MGNITFRPPHGHELKPRITVIGVGGAGGNAVNNMIQSHLEGVEFIVANTDAQALQQAKTDRRIQLGMTTTQGLGAGSRPDIGRAAAEESLEEILVQLQGSNMVFITAGMGGGTGTGAAPVIARAAREHGILTVGVVTKPFHFEGRHRMKTAEAGIDELQQYVDTLIIIPNQNLFRIASEKTTFADAFKMADDVLHSGVRGVTDLMIMPGLINLDFADIRTVMSEMGKAMMGTGEAEGDKRALDAAEAAISNPLLDDTSMKGARGVLINITGGPDMTLFEVDEAANRIRDEVDPDANIIFGSTFDEKLEGRMRVSVVATGIEAEAMAHPRPMPLPEMKPAIAPQPAPQPVAPVRRALPNITSERPVAPPLRAPAAAVAHQHVAMPMHSQAATAAKYTTQPELTMPPVASAQTATALAIEPAQEPEITVRPADLRVNTPTVRPTAQAPVAPQRVAPPTAPAPQPETRRTGSTLFGSLLGGRRPAAPAKPADEPAPAPQAAGEPRLQGADREDRATTSSHEDDLLDIPAFLRRQAN